MGRANKKLKGATPLLDLPAELLLEIASYLEFSELCAFSATCKRLNTVLKTTIESTGPEQYLWVNNDSLYKVIFGSIAGPTLRLVYRFDRCSKIAPLVFPMGRLLLAYEHRLYLFDRKKQGPIESEDLWRSRSRVVGLQKISDRYFQVITDRHMIIYEVEKLKFRAQFCSNKRAQAYPVNRISTPRISVCHHSNQLVIFDSTGSMDLKTRTVGLRCYGLYALGPWKFLEINDKYIVIYKIENIMTWTPVTVAKRLYLGANHILVSETIPLSTLTPDGDFEICLSEQLSDDIFSLSSSYETLFWSQSQKRVIGSLPHQMDHYDNILYLSNNLYMTTKFCNHETLDPEIKALVGDFVFKSAEFWTFDNQEIKHNLPIYLDNALKLTDRYSILWNQTYACKTILLDVKTFTWKFLDLTFESVVKISNFFNEYS